MVPWGEIAKQAAGHVTKGLQGITSYMSAKRQLQSAERMQKQEELAGLIDMALEQRRQEAARSAMKDVLSQISDAYGRSNTPEAKRSQRKIHAMVRDMGLYSAQDAADQAVEGMGGRRLALRKATALGPGGSVDEQRKRAVTRADIAGSLAPKLQREEAERKALSMFQDEEAMARRGANELGGMFADIRMPYEQIRQTEGFKAAADQESLRHIPGAIEGVQQGLEDAISSYLRSARMQPEPQRFAPGANLGETDLGRAPLNTGSQPIDWESYGDKGRILA